MKQKTNSYKPSGPIICAHSIFPWRGPMPLFSPFYLSKNPGACVTQSLASIFFPYHWHMGHPRQMLTIVVDPGLGYEPSPSRSINTSRPSSLEP
jgi:hypothetical protein